MGHTGVEEEGEAPKFLVQKRIPHRAVINQPPLQDISQVEQSLKKKRKTIDSGTVNNLIDVIN